MNWFDSIEEAIQTGPRIINDGQDLDRAAGHVCQLLEDAVVLFQKDSHGTATFLAVTALEETVKVHVGFYRSTASAQTPRKRDPLFQHRSKHVLAASPTIAMGSRLDPAIGPGRTLELLDEARAGVFLELRESALYFASDDHGMAVPKEAVTRERAREIILFAIEAFDDALVGYTNQSFKLGDRLDVLFTVVAG
jgi:AbiV family abortive infection protein